MSATFDPMPTTIARTAHSCDASPPAAVPKSTWVYEAIAKGLLPDFAIRWGIRRMLRQTLRGEKATSLEAQQAKLSAFIQELKNSPIAIETQAANTQHYEVPSEFYTRVLGPRLKYSSGYWTETTRTLGEAEETMLGLTCARANIQDGQTILDLGCGWGSLSLWLAEQYPHARIVGLSNSCTQKTWIDTQAQQRRLTNLTIVTANIADFDWEVDRLGTFDRILSIEMFEHMKNYQQLLQKIARWLTPEGKLFVHIFTHKTYAYHYEDTDGTDWLTRHFFTGGTMPSHDLLLHFQDDVTLLERWSVDGTHYEKTANAWLNNMDCHRDEIVPILETVYGKADSKRWWHYWRLFFMACAELWGYQQGQEWLVSHYLFSRKA